MANSKLTTDYSPEACDEVVALMGAGHTLTGAAGAMEISLETINRWMDEHEEFRDAVSRGRLHVSSSLKGRCSPATIPPLSSPVALV